MKIHNEEMILNKEVRTLLIKEIEDVENISRKREAFKRYEILKDRIKKYILRNLLEELDPETVQDMQSRIATVNIYKKVVGKKARVYRTTPRREAVEGISQEQLDEFIEKMGLNVKMKKANKYLEAMLNTDIFVRPIKEVNELTDSGNAKYSYRVDPMPPHKYDVIQDANDPERAMGYILSPFHENSAVPDQNPATREQGGVVSNFRDGDNKDQMIADSGADQEKQYIWWGNKFHFTFNKDGEIIGKLSPEDLLNPIQKLPFESLAKDRDGEFWAVGGEDLIEGSILINTILSDIYYIAKMHGTGLFYLFGKGVPKSYKVGPNQAITMDVAEGDPTPTIGFANANPQLNEHKQLVEQYLAILLTTNDLEPGSVQGQLNASTGSTSGVQEMIMKSEPVGSVEADQEIFRIAEPGVAQIAARWHNLYLDKNLLIDRLAVIGKIPQPFDYTIKFGAVQQFMSEQEKLEVISKRLEIGLDTMVDAIMLDNPDLSEGEAQDKLKKSLEEKLERAKEVMANMIEGDDADNQDEDQLQSGPGGRAQGSDKDGEGDS